jgi:hyperosmotically inducible periplasmic protein
LHRARIGPGALLATRLDTLLHCHPTGFSEFVYEAHDEHSSIEVNMHQYHRSRVVHAIGIAVACLAISIPALAQAPADNTKVNEKDRNKGAVTADQQKENATDRDIAQKIRQSIVSDKALSTYAHNVKVVAIDGRVTLKGPVRSDNEKRAVEAKAADVVGAANVTNDITVAPPSKPKS